MTSIPEDVMKLAREAGADLSVFQDGIHTDVIARAMLTNREARSGWRSIETAPQDGTQIIGRTTPDEVFACRWFLDDDGEGDWLAYGADVVRPREWMPDPSETPPSAAYPVIPAGYKLVPVEPTEEMMSKGADVFFSPEPKTTAEENKRAGRVYRAMLAASPSPSREETEWEKGELDWKNGEARSPLGDLYEACQLSPLVWVARKNGTEIATWVSSESLARGVAQADFDRLKKASTAANKGKSYHVVFDKFPDHDAPRFIELEDDNGRSISAGEWKKRDDGLVELVLPAELSPKPSASALLLEAEKALEPFAKASEIKLCGDWKDEERFAQTDVGFHLNFGHLRAARSTLSKIRGGE